MERRTCLLSAAVVATLLVAELATAAEPEAFEPPKGDFITSNTDTRSYAGTLLLVDGICLAHVVGGAYGGFSPALPALGIGGYFVGGPIVHLSHRKGEWRAVGSLGLRTGLFFLMTMAADGVPNRIPDGDDPEDTREGSWLDPDKVASWGLLALTPGMILDAVLLGREPIAKADTQEATVLIQPWFTSRLTGLGLQGNF